MIVVASNVQIAVELADASAAQAVFDSACPGVFDVETGDRTLYADEADPNTPTFAVAQGPVEQADYAALAALAQTADIFHLAVGTYVRENENAPLELLPAAEGGSLWEALGLVPYVELI